MQSGRRKGGTSCSVHIQVSCKLAQFASPTRSRRRPILQERRGRAIERTLMVDIGGELMLRLGLLCLLVSGSVNAAMADSALERGDYLVNTILACGNCHTPRDANSAIIKDKALS